MSDCEELSVGMTPETTEETNPQSCKTFTISKPAVLASCLVFVSCMLLHFDFGYFTPETHGCSLSFNEESVSETLNGESNYWTYAPKTQESRLVMRHDVNSGNSKLRVTFDCLFRYFDTVVNLLLGIWLIVCLPVFFGMGGLIEPLESTPSPEDCLEYLILMVTFKIISTFMLSAALVKTCTYNLSTL